MPLHIAIPQSTSIARHTVINAEAAAKIALERLATGVRVNRAADDAAGLAIAQRHDANLLGLVSAARNSAQAMSALALADGVLSSAADSILRIAGLGTAAQNPVLGANELTMLQGEAEQMLAGLNQSLAGATFNQMGLFSGQFKDEKTQIGANSSAAMRFNLPEVSTSNLGAYIFYADGISATTPSTDSANNPVTVAEDLTISGSIGSLSLDAIAQEEASNLAARINLKSEITGVSAHPQTRALLTSNSESKESIRLLINGTVTQAFTFSANDLIAGTEAINALAETTGVRAETNAAGIRLTHASGADITIENMASSTNLSVRKIAADGLNYVGAAIALQGSGDNDSTRVTGSLLLSSSGTFGVSEAGNTGSESIVLETDTVISPTLGDVSIVDGYVYLGNGAGADAIGSIDVTQNGLNGQPLKINRGQFDNNDFETGTAGDTSLSGWSITNSQVKLNGASDLGGQATPSDTNFPSPTAAGYAAPYDQMTPSSGSYETALSTDTSTGAGLSVRLRSTGITVDGYGIVHGPAIVSDSSVELHPGDSVSFQWRASGGDDAYDVIGYLVDENTGRVEEILNETGANADASTAWAAVSRDINTSGSYKFVFIAGTWDATGGSAAGAQLYIDNIAVTQNSAPPLENKVVEQIAARLTSSRNGYMQPFNVISNGVELSFTVAESSIADFVAIDTIDLLTDEGRTMANIVVSNSITQLATIRAGIGAVSNRLHSASEAAMDGKHAMSVAHSKLVDADYAVESARLARAQLLQQTATSMLVKSNGLTEAVLELLRDD